MFDLFYYGPKPNLFAFEKSATSLEDAAQQAKTSHFWYIYGGNDYTGFNFDYTPVPWENEHLHVWASQHQINGDVYLANKQTYAQRQWHFRTEQQVIRRPTRDNWTVPDTLDETAIDFSWHPNSIDPKYVYHFGSEWQETTGLVYTVPGATEIKLMGPAPGKAQITQIPTVFFIDKNNPLAETRMQSLRDLGIDLIKTRYFGTMFETIKRCAAKTKTTMFWIISSENDYTEFDFTWHPNTWQQYMTHVFGSKWNTWTDTFLFNRFEFARNAEWAKGIEEFPNLNFVQDQLVTTADDSNAMYFVDHGNAESKTQFDRLKQRYPNIRSTRFVDNYLDTFKRIMTSATTENVWIISSLCDYSSFDFTWQPGAWEREQIHCFSNGSYSDEKRGDTFYIPVEIFKSQMYELELLDWFNVISYNSDQEVKRWPVPVVQYEGDSLVEAIKNYEFTSPYAVFANQTFEQIDSIIDCVWTEKDRWCRPMSTSNGISVVPRDIKKYLKTQIYDYPYLWKYQEGLPFNYYTGHALDVVYISNGEPDAEKYYERLQLVLSLKVPTVNFPKYTNKLHRVQNVNGRVAAYQAAARTSTTPWFFAVFAKLEVDMNFDFNWQPDMWQEPKHYIFNARNPVNGLEYGHMGMIAYNRRLVLENNTPGIDFTLSQPHESVPILSGVAHYNQDAWTTWRTAFREVLKLQMFMENDPTLETEHRLDVWCTVGQGQYAEYSILGARDAIEYYNEVAGDPAELQQSFDWTWLKERFKQ